MLQKTPQLYIQFIIAVSGRQNIILSDWKDELHKCISGIISEKKHKSIIVNGRPDHIHAFIGLNPSKTIGDLVEVVKNNSANFINDNQFVKKEFKWQEGFGAFSHHHSEFDSVYEYILNQEKYHKTTTFKQEFIGFLNTYEIEFDEKDLFEWIDY